MSAHTKICVVGVVFALLSLFGLDAIGMLNPVSWLVGALWGTLFLGALECERQRRMRATP